MRRAALLLLLVAASLVSGPARADGFDEVDRALRERGERWWDVSGLLRVRSELLYNLDLDRGPTPSGAPLFPVPISDPTAQTLTHADLRMRTDLGVFAPGGALGVRLRVDLLDNLAMGSSPEAHPTATTSQAAPDAAFRIKRAYGLALTPLGILAAGRMGNHFGLGMLANGGECDDCDSGDAADRIAFITPLFGHLVVLAWDFSATGPSTPRADAHRSVDLDPADDVTTVTLAVLNAKSPQARDRRRLAGQTVVEYGAVVSHRWQEADVPASYLPTAQPIPISETSAMARDFRATALDGWLRITHPFFRLELEAAVVLGRIGQASLVPGVLLNEPVESTQVGLAFESDVGAPEDAVSGGLDCGYASGDSAPGFGAFPGPTSPAPHAGDLDGPQANPPGDHRVDNFRFHPDYRIDRILFRELVGTVTDAMYLRPHVRWRIAEIGPGTLSAHLAVVGSRAVSPESTPGGESALGIEVDPTLNYHSRDGFDLAVEYAALFPLAGLDNPDLDLQAKPAQLLRLRLGYGF